jgi:putative membrane protein
MIGTHGWPALNALLNLLSALFLTVGFIQIRNGRMRRHRAFMLAAFATSSVFLGSYLAYHYSAGSTRFQGQGWIRPTYFAILISHSFLAALVVPLVLVTLSRGLRERFPAHRRVARWTLPIWLYVSVTGVVVYVMLYHLS